MPSGSVHIANLLPVRDILSMMTKATANLIYLLGDALPIRQFVMSSLFVTFCL